MITKLLFFAAVFMVFPSNLVFSADVALNGFLQGNYSYSLPRSNPDGGSFKWAEERLQVRLEVSGDTINLFSKTDLFYDHIDREADPGFREFYLDYAAEYFDLRMGRQIITWGVGDLVFVNDLFPKDYEAFFSGRPLEYFKHGSDGLKVGLYPKFASLEVVIIPFFEPDNFPSSRRFHLFDPLPGVTDRQEEKPPVTFDNTELAGRIYRDIAGFDASLYFYRGFFGQPSMMPDDLLTPSRLTLFYPELSACGVSLQGRGLGGVVSLEAGYYDSRGDRDGSNPVIPNSQTRFLIGYQRQLWEDFTAGFQYFGEYMHDYSNYQQSLPQGFPEAGRLRDLLSVRLTRLLMHQTLRLSLFSFLSLSDGDYLINPEVKYGFTDSIWAAAGAVVFGGGEDWTQFGQLDDNDNLYLQVRYEF